MRVLITGSNGQLGSEIKDIATNYPKLDCFFKDLPKLNICDFESLESFIRCHKINAVINCAAYTEVDNAEENIELANNVNSKGVLNIVNALKKVNGKLIHISTDYVFNGNKSLPYTEVDPVNPIGIYGKTKRSGELVVKNSEIDAMVIRTSWLYSTYGNNFLKTILRLGNEKESLNIIYDQKGSPTYAKDLAKTCLEILCKPNSFKISNKVEIYHYSNEGVASWFDFAEEIVELANIDCKINPIQSKDYYTLASRPKYSVLDKTKIKRDFEIDIPHWKDSLKECLKKTNK